MLYPGLELYSRCGPAPQWVHCSLRVKAKLSSEQGLITRFTGFGSMTRNGLPWPRSEAIASSRVSNVICTWPFMYQDCVHPIRVIGQARGRRLELKHPILGLGLAGLHGRFGRAIDTREHVGLLKPRIEGGRGERIRTSDPLVPNQMRYQAAPRPETFRRAPVLPRRPRRRNAALEPAASLFDQPNFKQRRHNV